MNAPKYTEQYMFQPNGGETGGLRMPQTAQQGGEGAEKTEQMRRDYLTGMARALGAKPDFIDDDIRKFLNKAEARKWRSLWARLKGTSGDSISPEDVPAFADVAKDLLIGSRIDRTQEELAVIGFYALALLYEKTDSKLLTKKMMRQKLGEWNVSEDKMKEFDASIEQEP